MLTADVVAVAIVTASRLFDVDPLMMIGATSMRPQDQVGVTRARQYAAVALDEVLNKDCPPGEYRVLRAVIGRAVGASNFESIVAVVRANHKRRRASWWKHGDFTQVCAAVSNEIDGTSLVEPTRPAPEPAPVPAPTSKPRNVDSAATSSVARQRVEPAPKKTISMAPAVAKPAPVVKEAPMCVGGVTVDQKTRTVGAYGKSVQFDIDEVVKMIAALVRVMPALLPNDRISKAIWGEHRANMGYVLPGLAADANRGLEMIGLRIRNMPKAGYSISKA